MAIQIEPFDAPFGARILGAELSAPPSEGDFGLIRQALLDHHVLAIPGQSLDAAGLVAFSRRFGPLEPHLLKEYRHPEAPEVLVLSNAFDATGRPKGIATPPDPAYHSDLSYRPRPTWVTLLYAVRVPPEGGDTLFVDMEAAYARLPAEEQARLEGLRAAHNYAYRYPERLSEAERAANPDVLHPVVRRHPETDRAALFINPSFTGPIQGLDEAEGAALKARLYAHCLQDRFLLRYRWSDGDLVLWDNASVIHSATEAPRGQERTLMRTTVMGSEPR